MRNKDKSIVMIEWTDVCSVDLGLFGDEDIKDGLQHPKVIIAGILIKKIKNLIILQKRCGIHHNTNIYI